MWFKNKPTALGDFEQLVLLGVLRLDDAAYGAAIRQEIHARSGRDVSINAVYTTLDRLETKGLLHSWTGEPTAQRGGRRRKFYALRPAGVAAMRQAYHAFQSMADGFEERLDDEMIQSPPSLASAACWRAGCRPSGATTCSATSRKSSAPARPSRRAPPGGGTGARRSAAWRPRRSLQPWPYQPEIETHSCAP